MDEHVLLGAWEEQPLNATEVGYDAAMAENIYWNFGGSPRDPTNPRADYNVIRAGGLHASAPDVTAHSGSETVAYDGTDEADLNFGPGEHGWDVQRYSRSACVPSGSECGYTVARFFYTGRPPGYGSLGYPINGTAIHQGYGKGVLFFDTNRQAARFMQYSDIESADSYWITDSDLDAPSQGGCALLPDDPAACNPQGRGGLTTAQRELPANYAYNVTRLERLQALNGASKPVVVDVETGCPFASGTDAGHCATPAQTVASAWHALIAGARGIIWFQHDFSGPCRDDRTFIDGSDPSSRMYNCQQTPGVTLHDVVQAVSRFDHEVTDLNDVLLAPTAEGYVSTSGDVATLAKVYARACYVFAASGTPGVPPPSNQTATFALADNYTGSITVLDENRTVQATGGVFRDTFADADAVHVYEIKGGPTCE